MPPRPCSAALARSNGLVKRRFLQFSLRGLLGAVVLLCLFLGGRHLLETYGSQIEIESARIGEPIYFKARYFCLFGPAQCHLGVACKAADGSWLTEGVYGATHDDHVKRSWLCLYTMKSGLYPVTRPCQVIVTFDRIEELPTGETEGRLLKEVTVDVK